MAFCETIILDSLINLTDDGQEPAGLYGPES
jgi:hypothetical protein